MWGLNYLKGLVHDAENVGGEALHGIESAWNGTVHGVEGAAKWLNDHMSIHTPRAQGVDGQQIYEMFHGPQAVGTQTMDDAAAAWREISQHHNDAANALQSATSKLGAAWQGQAAGAAATSVVPLRQSADEMSQVTGKVSTTLQAQSQAWNDTKNKVVQVGDPPQMNVMAAAAGPVAPLQFAQQQQQYSAGTQANQQAFQTYGTSTATNTNAAPPFTPAPPPQAAPASAPSAQSVSPVGAAFSSGGSGASPGTGSSGGESGVDSASGAAYSGDNVRSGELPVGSHSQWQVPDTMQRPSESGVQQGQDPVAGAGLAAGGAALAAGVGAVAGGSLLGDKVGGSGLRARGLSGGSTSGSGAGSKGSLSPDGKSGADALGEEEEEAAAARGSAAAAGARGSVSGGMAAGAGAGARKEEDKDHQRPDYLVEANPHEYFGDDQRVAPPVFGEQRPDPAE